MIRSIGDFQHPFFIGIAGSGMSAIAQYLKGTGKNVSGSDRFFVSDQPNETREKLEAEGISCFPQDGSGITGETDLVVVSTAIEDTVPEVQKARQMGIPFLKRSELLALIAGSKRTIAVAGTSGKSTTSAMLFDILELAGMEPSIISGAGLVSLIRKGKIGNAKVGKGEWLVIEADESDGSIVQYKPEIGLLLNIDKDHQEISELISLFGTFKQNSRAFSVNRGHALTAGFSQEEQQDFSADPDRHAGYMAIGFRQEGLKILFEVHGVQFEMQVLGKHNMENALAAITVANGIGVSLEDCAAALKQYEGIYRRHQVYGQKNGVWLIDDFAHNPVKCAAAITACRPIAAKVIAWFQPHGYKPTKFLRDEFVREISGALGPGDEIWMSEIFYAGGTAVKDISAAVLVSDLRALGKNGYYCEHRGEFLDTVRPHLTNDCVLLLMGARDPSLESFAREVWINL
ncbi:MAG: UDP-N-acetylmuramate--L-alanine ligase [Chitinophagaceae bacterium]